MAAHSDACLDLAGVADPAIRGAVLRDLLLEHGAELTRLTISHAVISGRVDLSSRYVDTMLLFEDVEFAESPAFADAHLRGLTLVGCRLPGVELTGAAIDHLFSIEGGTITGCVHLAGTRLGRGLRVTNVTIADDDVAVAADWIRAAGTVSISSSHIGGMLSLVGAVVEGHLDLDDSDLDGRGQFALNAKLARIDGNLYLRDARVKGELRLGHVAINGDLDLRRASLDQDRSLGAVSADSARIVGRVRMSDGFSARGEVSFVAANLRDIDAAGAHLFAERRALFLDRASIINDVALRAGFRARGELSLRDCQIGGALDLSSAALAVEDPTTAPCLRADNAAVVGDVILTDANLAGGLRLPGTSTGQLVLTDLIVQAPGSTAVSLRHARIRSRLLMRNTQIDGLLDLREAHMNDLDDTVQTWSGVPQLDLDGLTYNRLASAGWSVDERLAWLRRSQTADPQASPHFRPGPYEQLAKTYRAQGDSELATRVLMARENDRLAASRPRHLRGMFAHLGRHVLKVLVGHGYRPGRAVWFLVFLIVAVGLFFRFGPIHASAMAPVRGAPSSEFNPFLYAADIVLPVIDLGESAQWQTDLGHPWAWAYRSITVGAIVTGWVLSTALVAALARLARSN